MRLVGLAGQLFEIDAKIDNEPEADAGDDHRDEIYCRQPDRFEPVGRPGVESLENLKCIRSQGLCSVFAFCRDIEFGKDSFGGIARNCVVS